MLRVIRVQEHGHGIRFPFQGARNSTGQPWDKPGHDGEAGFIQAGSAAAGRCELAMTGTPELSALTRLPWNIRRSDCALLSSRYAGLLGTVITRQLEHRMALKLARWMAVVVALLAAPHATAQDIALGLGAAVTSIDPHFHNLASNIKIAMHIFEPLVDQDALQRPVPALASAWKAIDETTWEFTLRSGVRFHDGQEFGAEDVVATLSRVPWVPNSPNSFATYTRPIIETIIVDAHTVRFRTAARSAAADRPVVGGDHFAPARTRADRRVQQRASHDRHRAVPVRCLPPRRPRHAAAQRCRLGSEGVLAECHAAADHEPSVAGRCPARGRCAGDRRPRPTLRNCRPMRM